MAKMVLKDCYISINSQNYSANVSKVELEMEGDDQDVTTFGSGGWKEILQGLKSGSLSVTFKDDFADSAVDDLLWAVFNAGSNVAFELRPTQSAVSVNNPKYTGNLTPTGHKVGGGVGDVAENEVKFPTSGVVTRAES